MLTHSHAPRSPLNYKEEEKTAREVRGLAQVSLLSLEILEGTINRTQSIGVFKKHQRSLSQREETSCQNHFTTTSSFLSKATQ
jgi:hypothetical protein